MSFVPMRHQDWGPAGNAGLSGGIPSTSGALQQATAPLPTPYPTQNNAPMAAPVSPVQGAMPPLQQGLMPPQRPPARPMDLGAMNHPAFQQHMNNWFQQNAPMWRRPMNNAQPQMQPLGALSMFRNNIVG